MLHGFTIHYCELNETEENKMKPLAVNEKYCKSIEIEKGQTVLFKKRSLKIISQ